MRTSAEGYQQCYNAQTVVEGENQLVVAAEVTDNAGDPKTIRPAKMAGRSAHRLDQGGDGLSTIQLPGPREGPGRVDPWCAWRST